MRPSGLHVNKPVIFGLLTTLVLVVLAYKYYTRPAISTEAEMLASNKPEEFPELSEEAEKALMTESKEIDIKVGDEQTVKIHVEQVIKDKHAKLDILFLHGASFSSQNWLDIKSTHHVANWGYRAVAIDLPGFNKSPDHLSPGLNGKFLEAFISTLKMSKVVVIAPSFSGSYALPFLFNDTNTEKKKVVGFVPVAPVNTSEYRDKYPSSQIPTLIVYGSKDKRSEFLENLQLLPNHKVVKIEEAGHACYLDKPDIFHAALFHFLKELAAEV